jgi:FMN phosphatase YigB (HAD superfamily)
MPTPQAVIFDLGKVLLDFDYGIAVRRLLPRCRVSLDDLRRMLTQDRLLCDYETGQLSTPEFFRRLQALTGYAGTLGEFRDVFGDIFTVIPPMVAMQAALRSAGVPTYILSNTNELAVDFIRAQFPFFRGFDGYVLSYEVRAMKPAPAIYEAAERLSGRQGAELLFLDDRPENVDAALARGWQAMVHHDPAETRAALVAAGLSQLG